MTDPLLAERDEPAESRRSFVLEDTGFDEVPEKYRRFYCLSRLVVVRSESGRLEARVSH